MKLRYCSSVDFSWKGFSLEPDRDLIHAGINVCNSYISIFIFDIILLIGLDRLKKTDIGTRAGMRFFGLYRI